LATLPAFKLPRVGLKEHLKVPDVKHDMDEKELLWRASMTPRIREYPFDRVPKVAFMFLTKGPVLMAPLWERFFQGHEGLYSIYVHSSPSYNESEPESPVFHGRRIPSKVSFLHSFLRFNHVNLTFVSCCFDPQSTSILLHKLALGN
jgi:hypothetical protein